MKNYLICGAAGAALIAGTAALAQPAAPVAASPYRPLVQKVVTRAEVQAMVAQHFAKLDTNRDGAITKAEADAAKAQRKAHRIERRADRGEHRFEMLDTNRDGSISRAEFDAHHGQRMAMRDRDNDGKPDKRMHRMHRGMGGAGGMGAMAGRMFAMADANHDGRVTMQEATAAALQHFDMADTNRDGQISSEERQQMHQRMRSMHQQNRG